MNKLREDLRAGALGAAAGVFSIGITLLIARIDSYYAYLSWVEATSYGRYDEAVENLWWMHSPCGTLYFQSRHLSWSIVM